MKSKDFKVRALPEKPGKSSAKGASRIYVNKDVLLELTGTYENGKPVSIEEIQREGQTIPIKRDATLWAAGDANLGKAVVQMSETFRDACGLGLKDQVKVVYSANLTVPTADDVLLEDITEPEGSGADLTSQKSWEQELRGHLSKAEHIFPGLKFKIGGGGKGQERTFAIKSINGSLGGNARYAETAKVRISRKGAPLPRLELPKIPGLEGEIRELNRFFTLFDGKYICESAPKSCGVVIHGGYGTGKTMLLNKIAETGWGTIHRIQPTEKLTSIQEILQRAREQQPSIILMDDFDRLIDKERSNRNAVIQTVADGLDKLAADGAVKGEPPKVVVIATCQDYLVDIPRELTKRDRFKTNISLHLPDVMGRRHILTSFNIPLHPDTREEMIQDLSERTHAYNGQDLRDLADYVIKERTMDIRESSTQDSADVQEVYISKDMFEHALQKIRPTAMHDINLKPPPVHWDDIGGQDEVKNTLQMAINMATESKEVLADFIDNPPKGFLLYGPPGCSKTMAAQALATECSLNFFAVKGAELLNMYVGESERQIRRLFERARAAAPSIIFFDEIDSIGGQRHGFGSGGGGSSATSGGGGSGLNVLTTLLNEMQGFELTQGVLVLAATNRPQALDPALLRPGRFDKLVYVSPPDERAREAIFRRFARTKKVAADVDVVQLAMQTEGYSGAEVVGICQEAGMAAMRRFWGSRADEDRYITKADLAGAIDRQPKMITREMLESYENWRLRFKRY
ncbi:hypothetical protein NKR23_g8158 [Pleurostoma richardsiae]|uniref:AAA+ ATPase domain-containing protein n=1 Tax=Pleurostoma richardsiae TaxID=41990 RepID=A0AA38VCW9_9PEZI|nr:hypothetical protein NKR23_g8158 [Pleurostoma richardsiae]